MGTQYVPSRAALRQHGDYALAVGGATIGIAIAILHTLGQTASCSAVWMLATA